MTAGSEDRVKAVYDAINRMSPYGHLIKPLSNLEQISLEPLPQFDTFLTQWYKFIRNKIRENGVHRRSDGLDDWLREASLRIYGVSGLKQMARETRSYEDYQAWTQELVRSKDWHQALSAFEEAAEHGDTPYCRGRFLDDAVTIASHLDKQDIARRLEETWLAQPTMPRLLRWLGVGRDKNELLLLAKKAISQCPKDESTQIALLNILFHDFSTAAQLLAHGEGLSWSYRDHSGLFLFWLFIDLIKSKSSIYKRVSTETRYENDWNVSSCGSIRELPPIKIPSTTELLTRVEIIIPQDSETRRMMIQAIRNTVRNRTKEITANKRRDYYGEIAEMIAACANIEPTSESQRWVFGLVSEYTRFPALQRELKKYFSHRE